MGFKLRRRSGAFWLVTISISMWTLLLFIGILLIETKGPNTEVNPLSHAAESHPSRGSIPSRSDKLLDGKDEELRWLEKTLGKDHAISLPKVITALPAIFTSPSSSRFSEPKREAGSIRPPSPLFENDIPKAGMILTDDDEREFAQNKKHGFNVFLSARIPPNRDIPDFRNQECLQKTYQVPPRTASIVICFHNEATSALLRTVMSIITRTANELLEEIILVDDASSLGELQGPLQSELSDISSKVIIIRLATRQGLIRARMFGARQATGDALVFLDSHTEVGHDWLDPLLDEIQRDPTTVVCPVIDLIQPHTLQLTASPAVVGGFNWGLHFRWDPVDSSRLESTEAIDSPTMSGGIFAMDRTYFKELGEYDEKMDIWGGENLELSFRIWMCGGRLKIHPCSRVGHIFRNERPYGNDGKGDTQLLNSIRVAKVWLDEHIEDFHKVRPESLAFSDIDVSERKQLRQTLRCHSFRWYIDNIYPEIDQPMSNNNRELSNISYSEKFLLQHADSELCLSLSGKALAMVPCRQARASYKTNNNAIVIRSNLCLDTECSADEVPCASKCHFTGGSQEWRLSSSRIKILFNPSRGLCLAFEKSELSLQKCNSDTKLVLWKTIDAKNKTKRMSTK